MLAGLVLTQEPVGYPLVAAVVAIAVAGGGAATLVLVRVTAPGRDRRARAARARAVRRGAEIGAVVGIVAALQVVHGLSPLTAVFVVLSFAIAEYVLSAGTAPSR